MKEFIRVATGEKVGPCVANGDYHFPVGLSPLGFFTFGASKTGAGASATIQLWKKIAGVKVNFGSLLAATNASPAVSEDEFGANGLIGFTVAGLNETDDQLFVEALQ